MALIEKLATDEDALSLLSEAMNFDFASKGLPTPSLKGRGRNLTCHTAHCTIKFAL